MSFLEPARLERALGVGRIIAGAGAWLAPRTFWERSGLPAAAADPEAVMLGRLFGSRDVVLGAALLMGDNATRRAVIRMGVPIDAADLIAAAVARRHLSPKALASLAGGAVAALITAAIVESSNRQAS